MAGGERGRECGPQGPLVGAVRPTRSTAPQAGRLVVLGTRPLDHLLLTPFTVMQFARLTLNVAAIGVHVPGGPGVFNLRVDEETELLLEVRILDRRKISTRALRLRRIQSADEMKYSSSPPLRK